MKLNVGLIPENKRAVSNKYTLHNHMALLVYSDVIIGENKAVSTHSKKGGIEQISKRMKSLNKAKD